jgi:cytochrome P450
VIADPYPAYAGLHRGPRVLHQERWDIWVLSRHQDVREAVRDHARLSSAEGVTYLRAPLPMMLTTDPPNHERLRRIVGREFAPRDIDRFGPAVERFVQEGLDETLQTGDLAASLAVPVPIRVMASILGVPESDIPALRRMADDLIKGFSIAPSPADTPVFTAASFDLGQISRAIADIHSYFTELVAERRKRPAEDLVTKLMQPADEGMLSEGELLWFCLLLLVAGIETTTNLIGNMVLALHEYPDQWNVLKDRRDLVPSAVNEALRYDAPIQAFFRTAIAPYQVGGVVIPERARVMLVFGAANRDPVHYEQPDVFLVDRNPTDHLAFGSGIHRCLGAGLAELEGRIVLGKLLERTDELHVDGDIVRTANPTLRGVEKLPINLQVP